MTALGSIQSRKSKEAAWAASFILCVAFELRGDGLTKRSAFLSRSESARTAQAAVVAGLPARLDVAGLLALEELDEFRDGLADACELLLTRMHGRRNIRAAQPHRARRSLRG